MGASKRPQGLDGGGKRSRDSSPSRAKSSTVPPKEGASYRNRLPTVVDEDALEAARLASLASSKPPRGASSSIPPLAAYKLLESGNPADAGSLTRIPVRLPRAPSVPVDNAAGFLLGFVDGVSTLQAIAEASGFLPADVLGAFGVLYEQGIVEFVREP
jgi:hypothetical protein